MRDMYCFAGSLEYCVFFVVGVSGVLRVDGWMGGCWDAGCEMSLGE